jgi:hypothetical protein
LERAERAALLAQTGAQTDQILFLVLSRLLAVAVVHPVVIQTSRVIPEALVVAVAVVALVLETRLVQHPQPVKEMRVALVQPLHRLMVEAVVAVLVQLVLTELALLVVMAVLVLRLQFQVHL